MANTPSVKWSPSNSPPLSFPLPVTCTQSLAWVSGTPIAFSTSTTARSPWRLFSASLRTVTSEVVTAAAARMAAEPG
ncbi:hypothetical protein D3C76_1549110 [compost metagenome]